VETAWGAYAQARGDLVDAAPQVGGELARERDGRRAGRVEPPAAPEEPSQEGTRDENRSERAPYVERRAVPEEISEPDCESTEEEQVKRERKNSEGERTPGAKPVRGGRHEGDPTPRLATRFILNNVDMSLDSARKRFPTYCARLLAAIALLSALTGLSLTARHLLLPLRLAVDLTLLPAPPNLG
jgi:hypothetical protein